MIITQNPDSTQQDPGTRVKDAHDIFDRLRRGEPVDSQCLDFKNISLQGEDLSGLQLFGADFSGADLTGTDLTGAQLFKARFINTILKGAKLNKAEMTGCDLTGANLEEADVRDAGLGSAILTGCKLFGANLGNATLTKASLEKADLRCAHLRVARIREARLAGADFTGTDLFGVDLSLTDVKRAIFNNADMRETRLRGVLNFEKAQWIGVDIRDVNFAGAYRLRRFIVDQNYIYEFKNINRFSRILYAIWMLTNDCGRSMFRWCACIVILSLAFAWLYSFVAIDYGEHQNWIAPYYFSVVTLTTLGYGDILPLSSAARLVALFEVMLGYMMLGGLLSILSNKMARRGE